MGSFSFPLITFGAATSALYYTANKTIRNGRGYIWQQFWRGFKSSFKQSTIATLIFAVIALILYNDAKIVCIMFEGSSWIFGAQVFFYALLAVLVLVVMYMFPYIARFSAPFKNVFEKLCSFMAIRHLSMDDLNVVCGLCLCIFICI